MYKCRAAHRAYPILLQSHSLSCAAAEDYKVQYLGRSLTCPCGLVMGLFMCSTAFLGALMHLQRIKAFCNLLHGPISDRASCACRCTPLGTPPHGRLWCGHPRMNPTMLCHPAQVLHLQGLSGGSSSCLWWIPPPRAWCTTTRAQACG